MFEYFWDTVETIDKSETDGFDLFGPEHILWLAVIIVLFADFAYAYKNLDGETRRKLRYILVSVLAFFEILRYAAIYAAGVPVVNYAPIQLCHICLYLVIIHCIISDCKIRHYIGNFLYLVGIPAGLSALLFPAWKSLPAFCNCSSLYSFITHALFVMYIIAAAAAGEIRRDYKTVLISVFMLLVMAAAVYAFDVHTGLNFMYLVKLSPGSPLSAFQGLGDYRIGYAVILAGLILVMYGVPELISKIRQSVLSRRQ